jgi:HK97 family phage major capsid protein
MTKIIAFAAASMMLAGAYRPMPPSYFGATRNQFMSPQLYLEPPDKVSGTELLKAIEARDEELVKKFAALKVDFDDIKSKSVGVKEELAVIAQRLAEGGPGPGDERNKSIGSQFIEDQRVKQFLEGDPTSGKVDMRIKATLTSATTDAAGSVGAGLTADRQALDPLPQRRLYVRDLVAQGQMSGSEIEWPVQKARTNSAAPVAEGDAKPQSDFQWEMKTFPARVIAHHAKASRQVLSDIPALRGAIDDELIYGLKYVEEAEILYGDNTGQHLNGMVSQATAYTPALSLADLNIMDVIGLAAYQVSTADLVPDGAIINAADWWAIRTLKDNEGRYIYGPPNVAVTPSIFGLPVVPTPAMTSRKFLVGAFKRSARVFDRWDARVELGYVNDDFTKNLVTLLGEERLAFAVTRATGLVYGDFDQALSS